MEPTDPFLRETYFPDSLWDLSPTNAFHKLIRDYFRVLRKFREQSNPSNLKEVTRQSMMLHSVRNLGGRGEKSDDQNTINILQEDIGCVFFSISLVESE